MATTTPPHPSSGQCRDFKGMERVRLRAARMFEHGTSQAEVAHRLGTSRQNAHRWHRKWQQGGRAALRAAGRAGRRPKLTPANAVRSNAPCATAPSRTGSTATCGHSDRSRS
jgi:transposase